MWRRSGQSISGLHQKCILIHQQVQAGALDLLADRLTSVSNKVRQEVTPEIVQIITWTKKVISLPQEGHLTNAAFGALKAISVTTSSGEESALTDVIPFLLLAIKRRKSAASAMAVLNPLTFVSVMFSLVLHFVDDRYIGSNSARDSSLISEK